MANVIELRSELKALDAEIMALHHDRSAPGGLRNFTPDEQKQYDSLRAEREELADKVAKHEAIATGANDPARTIPTEPPARRPGTGNATRDAAMRTLDESVRSGHLPEHAAEKVDALVNDGDDFSRSIAARWTTAAGDPAYAGAFAKIASDPTRGHLLWTPEEQAAYRSVVEVRAAMSLTDANGGYMVPLTLDPAIMLTSDGSINPLRQISRVVQTATDQWKGITSAGATAEWKAEGIEAADGSPTVDDADIPVHFGDVYVPFSYEVGMDARNFLTELSKVMRDSADQLQATAFTTGSGNGQPKGFVTALAGTASEINSGGSEALAAADAYTLQNALPPRFQANARFVANIATINTFAQFETTNGALKFPEIANDRLLRKPLHELSNMDGSINAAATANNYLMAYGDFREGFVIVDRIGSQVEFVANILGENGRPTGQRGAFLWFRTGSDVVVPQALRLLDVPTTA
jgi:HK97 family phage major capsid protein